MSYVLVHDETGKYISRKGIGDQEYRLTEDIGNAQIFGTTNVAKRTLNIMHEDYATYRKWKHENVPADGFTIFNVVQTLGDPA